MWKLLQESKKIGEYFDLDRGDGICKYLKKIYARFMIPDL